MRSSSNWASGTEAPAPDPASLQGDDIYAYPITIHAEADHYWSSCPDIPEAHSAGDTVEELLSAAVDGLCLALTIYVDQGRRIPTASQPTSGQHMVHLPLQAAAKVTLWNALQARGMRVADLARTLGVPHPVATRLVDFEHNSKIEQLESALATLGQRLVVSAVAAWCAE